MFIANLLFIVFCFSNLEVASSGWYDEFTEGVRNFLSKSEQSIRQGWETRKEDVKVAIQKTKIAIGNVVATIEDNSERIKSKFLRTAETTLKGAGDEVYIAANLFDFNIPKTVDSGFRGLATKAEEGVSWIFRNIICPILFVIISGGLIYLSIVSGCCGCCLSQCINSISDQLRGYFKRTKSKHPHVIVLKSNDADDPKDHLV